MPDFTLTGQDGGSYTVTAPDENSAMQAFQSMHGGAAPAGNDAGAGGAANAFATSAFDGVPIVGPYIKSGMQKITAFGQSRATGQPYDQALGDIQGAGSASQEAHPYASTAGSIAGGVGGGAAEMAIPGAGAFPLLSATAMGGADGAVRSGGDPIKTAEGAGLGLGGGLAGKALGAIVRKAAGAFSPSPSVPSASDIAASTTAAYNAADKAGVMYSPSMSSSLAGAIRDHMANFGYDPTLQPGGGGVLSTLDGMDGQNVTLKGVDTLRKVVNRMGGKGSTDSGQELARGVRGIIDDRLNNPVAGDVLGGDQGAGVDALNEARRQAQIGFKINDLDTGMAKSQDQAAVTGSGGNARNKAGQMAVKLKYGDNNWTTDEMAALNKTIHPGGLEQALRVWGKMDPTAHGLAGIAEVPITTYVASEAGGPYGLGLEAARIAGAMGASRLSKALVNSRVNAARSTILNGGVNPYAPSALQNAIGQAQPAITGGAAGGALQLPQLAQ